MPSIKKLTEKYKIDYWFLALVMSFYYGQIQWNNFIGDPDGFYHAKLAKLLSQGVLIKNLPWMQFSTLKDNFTDHQLLYHIILSPFTIIFPPLLAVKIATVTFAVAMILTFYWFLKKFKIPWPLVFALAFLLLNGLNFRISLIKVNSLSLLIVYLLIYALFKQKYQLSTLLGILFVWLYGGWPLAILILIVYIISAKIHQQLAKHKLKIFINQIIRVISPWERKPRLLKTSLYLIAGLIAGLIINPYWPQNIYFYYQQFLQIGVVNMGGQFNVGNEWYGVTFSQIFSSSPHLLLAALLALSILFLNIKKSSHLSIFSFLMAFGFLLLTLKSKRYIEYCLPFTLLFTASAVKDINEFFDRKKYLKKWQQLSSKTRVYLMITLTCILIMIMPLTYDKLLNVRLSGNYEKGQFVPASRWLEANTPKNSIVFHSDWDEWPILFYNSLHNYYIIGLDPTFMENYDANLHRLYRELTYGNISYKPARYIKNNFQAQYIFVDKSGHDQLIKNLSTDKEAKEVYQDNQTIIYKII